MKRNLLKKKKGHDKNSSKPANEPSSNMKEVLFVLKSVLADHDEPCYALTCTSPICPLGPTSSAMPLVGTCRRTDQFIRTQVQWRPASGRTVILEPI